ncbi:hypothetical protein FB107DRAFT_280706 [Schizophyllum commune]
MDFSYIFDTDFAPPSHAIPPGDSVVVVQVGAQRIAFSRRHLQTTASEEVVRLFARELCVGYPRDPAERDVFWRDHVRVLLADNSLLPMDFKSYQGVLAQVAEVHLVRPKLQVKTHILDAILIICALPVIVVAIFVRMIAPRTT